MSIRGGTGRAASRAGDVLLTVASIAGALCILGAIAAATLHVTLILFSTGSMSPGIPAGAVALVREIPATEARVGDVVTVDRPHALPITHRVVTARPLGDGRVQLVLRGDANAENDPAPYDVTRVRLVFASVPGGAQVISALSSPLFLGGATLAATALVAWAFWPREGRDGRARRGGEPRPNGDGEPRRDGEARPGAGAALLLLVTAGAASTLVLAPAAAARADETVSSSRYLTLTSLADPDAFAALAPGRPVRWEVGVAAATPTAATVGLGLSSTGPLTEALAVRIRSCTVRWSGDACPGTAATIVESASLPALLDGSAAVPGIAPGVPPAPAGVTPIAGMPSSEERWLALDVTLRRGPSTGSADLQVWAWTSGDDARTSAPPAALAATGSSPALLAPLLAGGAVAAGAAIAAIAAHAGGRHGRHGRRGPRTIDGGDS